MKWWCKIWILTFFIFSLSVMWCGYNINTYFHRQNWIETTAKITYVGLPDGAVIGMYTDINGNIHSDVTLYIDYFHQGHSVNVDGLIGKEIDIVYNPLTGEVDKNDTILYGLSFLMFLFSLVLLCICNRKIWGRQST